MKTLAWPIPGGPDTHSYRPGCGPENRLPREARILIANVVIDLALSPKSNSAITAIDKAMADLRKLAICPSLDTLQDDGHYAGSKELGNAENYKYPSRLPREMGDQQYLPDKLARASYFSQMKLENTERLWNDPRKN